MPNFIPPNTTIRLKSKLLPVLAMILFVLVVVDGYKGWVILLVPLAGTCLIAVLWVIALANGLNIRREVRLGWAQVGDRLEERFVLSNSARLSALWVEVIGQTNMPDYWANQVRAVKRESETRWQIRGVCTRRGVYTLGPTSISTYDPFGIYQVTIQNLASTTLVVTPPVIPLPFIQVAPGGFVGEGLLRNKSLEQDITSTGVREYFPGDQMRTIHWPTSARKQNLFVREFEHSTAGDWWIVLDLDQEVQVGKGQNATQEHAIILGASLTETGMHKGHSVGLAADGDEFVWHKPKLSEAQKWEIMRSLAMVEPGQVPLGVLLSLLRQSVNPRTSLIIITPEVDGKWLSALLALRRLGVVPTILLFDVRSYGGLADSTDLVNKLTTLGIKTQTIKRQLLEHAVLQKKDPKEWGWQENPERPKLSSRPRQGFSGHNLR